MNKKEKYEGLLKQIKSVISEENDLIANLSNIASLIHFEFNHHWTGFYFMKGNELVLGPFQGPVACTRIPVGKGVCGTSAKSCKTIIVEDVHTFPGHIACSALSNSEIVVPLSKKDKTMLLLDIDSKNFSEFDFHDQEYLEEIISYIREKHYDDLMK